MLDERLASADIVFDNDYVHYDFVIKKNMQVINFVFFRKLEYFDKDRDESLAIDYHIDLPSDLD